MKTYVGLITQLKENQVFVFGSNLSGFHGAGAAGFASFGSFNNNEWRNILYYKWPNGKKGKWNIKGIAEGLQEGNEGKSYAIPTISYPGCKRSISLNKISKSIDKLYLVAIENPKLDFLVAYGIRNGLSGYTSEEMANVFARKYIPENIIFEEEFSKLVLKVI